MPLSDVLHRIHYQSAGEPNPYSLITGHGALRKLEIWSYSGSTSPVIVEDQLSVNEFHSWVQGAPPATGGLQPDSGLRLLILKGPYSKVYGSATTRMTAVSNIPLKDVMESFEVPSASLSEYLWSKTYHLQKAHVQCKPGARVDDHLTCYWLRLRHRDQFLTWTFNPKTRINQGILMLGSKDYAGEVIDAPIVELLKANAQYIGHPTTLAFVACIQTIGLFNQRVQAVIEVVGKAEQQTGSYKQPSTQEARTNRALLNFGELSSDMSAVASGLAVSQGIIQTCLETISFATAENETFLAALKQTHYHDAERVRRLEYFCHEFRTLAESIRSKARAVELEAQMTQERAQIQLSVIYNFIAQRDQTYSLAIAEDSRTLAIESKRDSSSMKTIAAVTMFFLPFTAVAVSSKRFLSGMSGN